MRLLDNRLKNKAPLAEGYIVSTNKPDSAPERLRVVLRNNETATTLGLYLDDHDLRVLIRGMLYDYHTRGLIRETMVQSGIGLTQELVPDRLPAPQADTEMVPKFNWPENVVAPANPLVPAPTTPPGTVVTEEYLRSIARSEVNEALGIVPEPPPAPPTMLVRYLQYRSMLFEQWDLVNAEFTRRVEQANRELQLLAAAEFPEHGLDGDE